MLVDIEAVSGHDLTLIDGLDLVEPDVLCTTSVGFMDAIIRPAVKNDATQMARIYNHYVANTCITFETEAVPAPEMEQRIADTLAIPLPWIVVEVSGQIVGYAYASKWKGRCAYRYSVESTVYIDPAWVQQGFGSRLYSSLLEAIRAHSMHAAIGGIALPNVQSVALHERLGFKKVAHFEEVGYKQNHWVDVGYWQLML